MRMHTAVFVTGFVGLGTLLLAAACGDDESKTEPIRTARKGEACQTTNDCAPGLACVPAGSNGSSICVLGAFTVAQTAKECAITECTTASDCCGTPNPSCENYKTLCDADASTSATYCQLYAQQCLCDGRDCENGKCIQKCNNNAECTVGGSTRTCAGGKCVSCSSDDQCGSSRKCVSGECQAPCEGDGDCPGFDRCINQQCTDGACQTNRECIAFTGNVEATCGTDGKCITPCTTDLECGSPRNFRFYSCVNNQCLFLGCETDKDCRLILEGLSGTSSSGGSSGTSGTTSSGSSSGTFSPTRHIVCRDKATPGNTVIPAR
jgi:hypothetical protein